MRRYQKMESLLVMLMLCLTEICYAQEIPEFIQELNRLNQVLKITHKKDQADKIRGKLWPLLDETLKTYLSQNDEKSVEQMNKELFLVLEEDRTVDMYQWASEIKLYDSKVPGVVLAVYTDWPSLGNVLTTMRVWRKSAAHWTVAGSMMDSPVVSKLMDEAREDAMKIASKPWHGKGPEPAEQIVARAFATRPIEFNSAKIFPSTVQPIAGGGVSFVSEHEPFATMAEPTLIKWEWTPTEGLQAVGWIWGYKWGYDAKEKSDVAGWETPNKNKKGPRVFLKDFHRP